jgi:hypothetical protein
MDPNPNNPGAAPPGTDPGQTRYFPPQDGYRAQEMPEQATQPVQPVQPVSPVPPQAPYPQQPYQPHAETPVSQQVSSPPASHYSWPAGRSDRDRTMLALLLIGGGILFLLGQLNPFFGFGDLVLLLLGGIFLYAYWNTRSGHRIGFLIPGAILFGLGVGQVLSNFWFAGNWGGDFTTLGLGLGFCLIWALERRLWWSLIPGSILVLVGLSSISVFGSLWPLALIALGVYLLYGHTRRPLR